MKIFSLWIVLASAILSVSAHAVVVTTSMDEDNGFAGGGNGISLREAVKYSASGSSITFALGLSGQTIRLTLGNLTVDRSLTVDASTLPQRITLSADRTGNGKSADDTYVIQLNAGDLFLKSLILADSYLGESQSCITTSGSGSLSLKLDRCTLTRNSGYHSGAISMDRGGLTISNSTFSHNSAVKAGSALSASGSFVSIENSTFSQNTGPTMSCWEGDLSLSHTTIAGNVASQGGPAIYYNAPGTFSLMNSIVTGNASTSQPNVVQIQGTFTGDHNVISGNPKLAPLGDYGGPTQTMPPLPGSPAISAASYPPVVATDQRGFPRIDKPEIGAVEVQASDTSRFWKLDMDGDGVPYGIEQALGTDPLVADATNPRQLGRPVVDSSGRVVVSFGKAVGVNGTCWILKRSPDLDPSHFVEIYRYEANTDYTAAGVSVQKTGSTIIVTDANPLPGQGFYRFEAVLKP